MRFDKFIGIDYSGAGSPTDRIPGLKVYVAHLGRKPHQVRPAPPARNWSRHDLAHWLLAELQRDDPVLIGIDHGFSFPLSYFARYGLTSWPAFLKDFCRHWPTDRPHCRVDSIRNGDWWRHHPKPSGQRIGTNDELRLCERWTSSAKSVFQFDVQGSVAKSTHAGMPWLRFLRERLGETLFFWPFDGWQPPEGVSVIAEVYPSILRNRYQDNNGQTPDERDAYAVARWLEESVRHGILARYLDPPLTAAERRIATLEGWILGIA
ncbi:MAG: hypothetical protein ACUVSD_01240 [Thiobacillaceae bacterium]